jgi:signal transduction histidine kinase
MDAARFLSTTISILAASPDFRHTLENLARLATSHLADWCGIFMFENEHTVRRLLVVQNGSSPAGGTHVEARYPINRHLSSGPAHVLRTGAHQLITNISGELAESLGLRPEELLAHGRTPSRCLCVPLASRGRIIGAMVFMSADPGVAFEEAHIDLARNLAAAAAVAMDNARLHRDAEEANRLKDEFVGLVSHELKTPLTPILGCIHLLRTANLSEANSARALEMIERNAQAQVQMVDDLLDVSRIVGGKLHLLMKSTDLVSVIEAAIESVRPAAEAKSIQIIANFEDIRHPINGDPNRLQQVMWNLLSNAVKFTPSGGSIEITICSDSDHIVVRVTDTGVGIPAEVLPEIFDRFRQACDGNSKMRSGLGLGLAIVRHLVELHNGSIEAASAGLGHGAIFTLKFPFAARKAACTTP